MDEPRQALMRDLGEGGCYFLSLVRLAEEVRTNRIDAIPAFLEAVKAHSVKPNGYIDDPPALLRQLCGGWWSVRKESAAYQPHSSEFEVLRFERPTPGLIYSHFVLGDGQGAVRYDPLGDSRTVREGELVSKRIFQLRGGIT